jgi:hypothetical protein
MGWPSNSERLYPKKLSTCAFTSLIFPSWSLTTMASGENSNSFSNKSLASTRSTLSGDSSLMRRLLGFAESASGSGAVGVGAPRLIRISRRKQTNYNALHPFLRRLQQIVKRDRRHASM